MVDLAALAASLDEFMSSGKTVADSTLRGYRDNWPVWEGFCTERGFAALPAPIEAFRAFLGAAARGAWVAHADPKGVPLTPGRVDNILSAVRYQHDQAGHTVAYRMPEHAASFTAARKGYKKSYGKPAKKAKPLTVPDLRKLLAIRAPLTRDDLARRAVIVLMLDRELSLNVLMRLRRADFTVSDAGLSAALGPGREVLAIDCDHRPRVEAVPHACTACAVKSVLDAPESP